MNKIERGISATLAAGLAVGIGYAIVDRFHSVNAQDVQDLAKGPTPVTRAGEFTTITPDGARIVDLNGDGATVTATRTVTPRPTEVTIATVVASVTATARPEVTPTPVKGALVSAERSGNGWVLRHPDEDKTEVRQLPDGFIPDRSLHFSTDIKALELGADLNPYKDWETALNTKRTEGALAGYNYDYNDWCPTGDFKCNVQGDMYGWRTFQGEFVEVPGIGRLIGGPRRSVVLNVLNLDGSVYAWDNEKNGQVTVKRGFTATGRIFDGEKNVDVLERNLSGHWMFRQFFGTPEKSYIGITDSPDNAREVLLVSVQRKQWGLNSDSSKRTEFQLIRAELIKGVK